MKLGRRALVFVALAAATPLAILAACGSNSFSSDDSDASIITAGGDGSTTTADATPSTSDAGVDAAPPPPTWCQVNAPNAFFCADFDEGDPTKGYDHGVLKPMFQTFLHDGGSPGISLGEGDGGKSPPGALSVFLPPITNPNPYEYARQQTPYENALGATGFQVDFDLRNDLSSPTSLSGETVTFEITDPTYQDTHLACQIDVNGGNVDFEGIGLNSKTIGPLPTVGIWTHYREIIQLAGDVTVQIDDGGVDDVGDAGVRSSTTNAQLTLGQECDVTSSGTFCNEGLSFDNVVIHALGLADGG